MHDRWALENPRQRRTCYRIERKCGEQRTRTTSTKKKEGRIIDNPCIVSSYGMVKVGLPRLTEKSTVPCPIQVCPLQGVSFHRGRLYPRNTTMSAMATPRCGVPTSELQDTVRFCDPARVYHADLRCTSGCDTRLYCIFHTPQSNSSHLSLVTTMIRVGNYYDTCSHSSVLRATVEFTTGRAQPAMPQQYYRCDFFLSQTHCKPAASANAGELLRHHEPAHATTSVLVKVHAGVVGCSMWQRQNNFGQSPMVGFSPAHTLAGGVGGGGATCVRNRLHQASLPESYT